MLTECYIYFIYNICTSHTQWLRLWKESRTLLSIEGQLQLGIGGGGGGDENRQLSRPEV